MSHFGREYVLVGLEVFFSQKKAESTRLSAQTFRPAKGAPLPACRGVSLLCRGGPRGRPGVGFPLHFRVYTPPQGRTECRGGCPHPPAGWPVAPEGRADVGVGPYKGLLWQALFAGGHKGRPYRLFSRIKPPRPGVRRVRGLFSLQRG